MADKKSEKKSEKKAEAPARKVRKRGNVVKVDPKTGKLHNFIDD